MSDFESIGGLFEDPIKGKKGRKYVRQRLENVANRSPEVMVKVTGHTKGARHMGSHLDYISRNGNVELETESGQVLKTREQVKGVHKEWVANNKEGYVGRNTRDTHNFIFSMPNGTDPQAVKNAVRKVAKDEFSENYQYVFALHEDTDSPHVHLTVRSLGFDGKRLHIKKGYPQTLREKFAERLRAQGIDAEATSRGSRGVIQKGISQVIKHIRDKGFTPNVDQARVNEILEEIRQEQRGEKPNSKPWEQKIADKQTEVRKTWLGVAKELLESDKPEDKKLSSSIVDFVKTMPPLKTVNHEIKEKLVQNIRDKDGLSAAKDDLNKEQEER
jgi:type IV secretion system T-DNA border endonuclease VirD2